MVHTSERSGITVDDLALMLGKQFKEIQGEFKNLESKMNERFDRMDLKFDLLEIKVMRDHEPRIKKIEEHLEIA